MSKLLLFRIGRAEEGCGCPCHDPSARKFRHCFVDCCDHPYEPPVNDLREALVVALQSD